MAKTLFEATGYKLGQKAAQAKNAFDLIGGTEEASLRAEIRLGRDLAAALVERTPLIEENEATRFVTQIADWLAANVKEKKLPFSVRVTAEREPNAFALPGGPVFVSWALLELCQGQRDEIAFVLGHEMGHIVRRHILDRIFRDAALSFLLRQSSGRQAASAWLGKAGRQVLVGACSREDELEANAFAVALLRTAGGDASAGERLLEKLAQSNSGQSVGIRGDYFAGHPPISERVTHLRARRLRQSEPSSDSPIEGKDDSPDVVCPDLPGFHFEVKAVERLNPSEAMTQAVNDAGERIGQYSGISNQDAGLRGLPIVRFLPAQPMQLFPDEALGFGVCPPRDPDEPNRTPFSDGRCTLVHDQRLVTPAKYVLEKLMPVIQANRMGAHQPGHARRCGLVLSDPATSPTSVFASWMGPTDGSIVRLGH